MNTRDDNSLQERGLVIIDWGRGGHSYMYLEKILQALSGSFDRLVAFSQYSAELAEFASAEWKGSKDMSFYPIQRASSRLGPLPRRIALRVRAWQMGRRVRKVLRTQPGAGMEYEVFFPCLAEWESIYYRYFCAGLGLRWSALLLSFKGMRMADADMSILRNLNEKECVGALTLDENRVDWLAERMPGKITGFLADVSPTQWDSSCPLADRICEKAKGRKIVLLIGRLRKVKGVVNFAHTALANSGEDLFFVMAGQLSPSGFDEEERVLVTETFQNAENCYLHRDELKDEGEYNAVFRLASIICIAYRNFPGSSNSLTKAAFFQIPVIVGSGYLLAERVHRYRIGEVVEKEDPEQLGDVIRRLANSGIEGESPDWSGFQSHFSDEAFSQQLRGFMSKTGKETQ
tara:strand:- start:8011 stop:9219 length:1209 start_codon:yes stop_codon:yes gene_type:complete